MWFNIGQAIGMFLPVVLPVILGIFVTNRINKNRDFESSIKWPRNLGIGLSMLFAISSCSAFLNPPAQETSAAYTNG
jgi:membrane protease YdiL (CAAX protease family)